MSGVDVRPSDQQHQMTCFSLDPDIIGEGGHAKIGAIRSAWPDGLKPETCAVSVVYLHATWNVKVEEIIIEGRAAFDFSTSRAPIEMKRVEAGRAAFLMTQEPLSSSEFRKQGEQCCYERPRINITAAPPRSVRQTKSTPRHGESRAVWWVQRQDGPDERATRT